MSKLWLTLLAILPGGCLFVAFGVSLRWWMRRRRERRRRLSMIYLRTLLLRCDGRGQARFPYIDRPGADMALAEAIAGLRRVTYGCDAAVLRSVVRSYDLEEKLLRRLRRPGADRPRLLALLSALPLGSRMVERLAPYARSRSREVRFYALLARLVADPGQAIPLLRDFPDPLSRFECAELTALMRRGALPLPCEPLLQASEENLRRVGLCIARHFGIDGVRGLVLGLTSDDRVGCEAMETLCDLHLAFPRRTDVSDGALSAEQKRALLRRAAYEGYALRAVEHLLCGEERIAFERLAATYKSAVLWS